MFVLYKDFIFHKNLYTRNYEFVEQIFLGFVGIKVCLKNLIKWSKAFRWQRFKFNLNREGGGTRKVDPKGKQIYWSYKDEVNGILNCVLDYLKFEDNGVNRLSLRIK